MDFRLIANLVTPRGPKIVNRAAGAARKNYELVFEPFGPDANWGPQYIGGAGASQVVALYRVPLAVPWTVRYPIQRASTSFVPILAVKSGDSVRRYKLWGGIGERISVPMYVGESVPAGTVIEIWSVPDKVPALATRWKLPLGLLDLPASPSDQDGPDITPTVCVTGYPPPPGLSQLLNSCTY